MNPAESNNKQGDSEAQEWILRLLALTGASTPLEAASTAFFHSTNQTTVLHSPAAPSPHQQPTSTNQQQDQVQHDPTRADPMANMNITVVERSTKDPQAEREREHRFLLKDAHRFKTRLSHCKADVDRLAAESEELEAAAAEKRSAWVRELRNFHQLEGIVGFIEARLSGLEHDMKLTDGNSRTGWKKNITRDEINLEEVDTGRNHHIEFLEPCTPYNEGWCRKGKNCPLPHVCCSCGGKHQFVRCTNRRQICYKWNQGRSDGCVRESDGCCRREHRCLYCAEPGHALCDCRKGRGAPSNMCLVWNSCGAGRACTEGTCGRIHRCIRCEGGHPVLHCPKIVGEYIEDLVRRNTQERPRKRTRWD